MALSNLIFYSSFSIYIADTLGAIQIGGCSNQKFSSEFWSSAVTDGATNSISSVADSSHYSALTMWFFSLKNWRDWSERWKNMTNENASNSRLKTSSIFYSFEIEWKNITYFKGYRYSKDLYLPVWKKTNCRLIRHE